MEPNDKFQNLRPPITEKNKPVAPEPPKETLESLIKKNNELLISLASNQEILLEDVRELLRHDKTRKTWAIVKYAAIVVLGIIIPFIIMQQVWNSVMGGINGTNNSSSSDSTLQGLMNITTGGAANLNEMKKVLK